MYTDKVEWYINLRGKYIQNPVRHRLESTIDFPWVITNLISYIKVTLNKKRGCRVSLSRQKFKKK